MDSKRIAFLTTLQAEDVLSETRAEDARYLLGLARSLVERSQGGLSIELLAQADESRYLPVEEGISVRCLEVATRPANPRDCVLGGLAEAVATADLVHIHEPFTPSGELALLLAKLRHKPVCVTIQNATTDALGVPLGSLELADLVICPSEFVRSFLQSIVPIGACDRVPFVVVRGGVDARFFALPANLTPRNRVVCAGRLLPGQGIDQLIAALPAQMPLSVCGKPCPYHLDYFQRLRALSAGKRVEFVTTANAADVRQLYWQAWVQVVPNVYQDLYSHPHLATELLGLTMLEAMACGTPVIAARVGPLPELVRHSETGFLYDNPTELTKYLQLLTSEPGILEQMGQRARHWVEQKLDFQAVGSAIGTHYDDLLSHGSAADEPAASAA